ncbi:UNVERIFIED_ORG: phage-related protein [Pantoea brenneri]|nr:phage-related protein [Pantoea brenneri]
MKDVVYVGGSQKSFTGQKVYPKALEDEVAMEINRLQFGLSPMKKTKAMNGLGQGVIEWIKNGKPAYRFVYVVGKDAIYILHAFSKTSDGTPKSEEDTIKLRYKMLPKDF